MRCEEAREWRANKSAGLPSAAAFGPRPKALVGPLHRDVSPRSEQAAHPRLHGQRSPVSEHGANAVLVTASRPSELRAMMLDFCVPVDGRFSLGRAGADDV